MSQEDGAVAQSTVTGTSGYMSPEQARGEPLDARSDIYSFGRVLSELAGERLASRTAPIIAKAMASEPAGRWQSAAELRTALEKIPRQASRKRWRLALLAAAFLACAVTIFIWTRPGRPVAEMNPVSLFSTTEFVEAAAKAKPAAAKKAAPKKAAVKKVVAKKTAAKKTAAKKTAKAPAPAAAEATA